jgi:SAM-dependent methyltransferase
MLPSFRWYRLHLGGLEGRRWLEIGGPSIIFHDRSTIPACSRIRSWDNVDFGASTWWSSSAGLTGLPITNGYFSGKQFIVDATRLTPIPDGSYDVVLSSHVIEHLANSIWGLRIWNRMLVEGGVIVAVISKGARTFSHARAPTPLSHLVQDSRNEVGEEDRGHLPEILQAHDAAMDSGGGTPENLVERSRRNAEFRALHHHVFTLETLRALQTVTGFSVDVLTRVASYNLLACDTKRSDGAAAWLSAPRRQK